MNEGLVIGYVKHGAVVRWVWCRNLRNFRRKVRRLIRNPDVAHVGLYRTNVWPQIIRSVLHRCGGGWHWEPWSQAGIRRLMGKGWKP